MTVPLIVLAVLSAVGGFLNVEHAPIVSGSTSGRGGAAPLAAPGDERGGGGPAANMNMPDYVPHPALADPDRHRHRPGGLLLAWFLLKPGRAARRGRPRRRTRRAGRRRSTTSGTWTRRTTGSSCGRSGRSRAPSPVCGPRGDRRHRGRRPCRCPWPGATRRATSQFE
jgi:hypothetical protein